ncbi:MAG TPA: amidohydrolase family protein [Acetobacteraceae bacterium]|nr:amidohydrolase family protein [Acetobacteraceae bacterium]
MTPRIDAHLHIWRVGRGDYGWIEPGSPLDRDFTLDEARAEAQGIGGIVLVQAAPSEPETEFLLAEARASAGLVRGVVGWTDLAAGDAPARIAALAADPLLRGLRPMLQDLPEPEWILRPGLRPALEAMRRHGLVLDLLVKPHQLGAVLRLAAAHPDLPMVLDHCGKPDIRGGQWRGWAEDIAAIARETRIACKLSGLAAEAGKGWRADDLRRHADHVLACFGPERVIWGSDWPVLTLTGSYRSWLDAALALTEALPEAGRAAIFGGNAASFYGLV